VKDGKKDVQFENFILSHDNIEEIRDFAKTICVTMAGKTKSDYMEPMMWS